MKKQLLPIAVLAVAQSLGNAKKAFSALDVTNSIRNLVNTGELEIVGVQQTVVGGLMAQEIEHESVRDLLRGIFDAAIIENLKCDKSTLLYHFGNADLNVYECVEFDFGAPIRPTTPAPVKAAPTKTVSTGGNKTVSDFVNARKRTKTCACATSPGRDGKLVAYLVNRRAEGVNPTLKMIQSRLKEYPGLTTVQIKDFVSGKGYRTQQTVGVSFSQTKVIV